MEAVRANAEKTVNAALNDESTRANVLDREVTEHKSKLIVETTCVKLLKEELAATKGEVIFFKNIF